MIGCLSCAVARPISVVTVIPMNSNNIDQELYKHISHRITPAVFNEGLLLLGINIVYARVYELCDIPLKHSRMR